MALKDWKKDDWESSGTGTTYIKRIFFKQKIGKRTINAYEIKGRVQILNLGNYYAVGTYKGKDKVRGSTKAFKTKTQALAYAKAYMRNN